MVDGVRAVSPLATRGDLGADLRRPRRCGWCGRHHRLVGTHRRWHHRPRPCVGSGGKKGGGHQALGRSRGGFTTKIHLRIDRAGKPLAFTLTPGQRQEATQLVPLLEGRRVSCPSGHRRWRPDRVIGDGGYTGRRIRGYLRRHRISAVIKRQKREHRRGTRFDRAIYRERNVIERLFGRLKEQRAIATRYEKLAAHYHALVTIACILCWL